MRTIGKVIIATVVLAAVAAGAPVQRRHSATQDHSLHFYTVDNSAELKGADLFPEVSPTSPPLPVRPPGDGIPIPWQVRIPA